jgi:hypothetical protein
MIAPIKMILSPLPKKNTKCTVCTNTGILQKFSNFKFSNKFLPNVDSKLILSHPPFTQFLLRGEVSLSNSCQAILRLHYFEMGF